jgi:hypothetical protein
MYCHLSRKGREGSFVVDADERCGRGRSAIVGASVATSSTGAASSFTTPAPAAATTGGRAVKASVDLEINLFFLLGASFGRGLCLADVIAFFLFRLGEESRAFEEVTFGAFISLASFRLGQNSFFRLLLSKILVKGESVVLFFFALLARRLVGWRGGVCCSITSGGGLPGITTGSGRTPITPRGWSTPITRAFYDGVCYGSFFLFELSRTVVSTPALVNLFVRISLSGLALSIERPATTATASTSTTATATTTFELSLAFWRHGILSTVLGWVAVPWGRFTAALVVLATSRCRTAAWLLVSANRRWSFLLWLGRWCGRTSIFLIQQGKGVFGSHRHC